MFFIDVIFEFNQKIYINKTSMDNDKYINNKY